jgi:hypothetical protein
MSQSAAHEILLILLYLKSCKFELLQDKTMEDEVRCDIFQDLRLIFLQPELYIVTNPLSICLGRLTDMALESWEETTSWQ